KGAVVSFALTSSENYVSGEMRDYFQSIYLSLRECFPERLIIPGDTAYFLASNEQGALTSDYNVLLKRLEERKIETLYVREYYLFDKLAKERVDYLKDKIERDISVAANEDFRPAAYYYATIFWGSQFDAAKGKKYLSHVTCGIIWSVTLLFCVAILAMCLKNRKLFTKRIVLTAVMTTGFSEIVFQMTVLLSFQIIYGYVYYKLGIIITSFMVGLAIGGSLMSKYIGRIKNDTKAFCLTQISICIYPLILPAIFLWLAGTRVGAVSWVGANLILPLMPLVAGVIGGLQFPLAVKLSVPEDELLRPSANASIGRISGLNYGLDLLGACVGSFFTVSLLVPVLGIFQTCFLAAAINFVVLVILLIGNGAKSRGK
ncbi:MAG: hypothetical protein PHW46_05450, partial [Candidatus Omnitrophica bacterium]|nr:hypothetical protein [Candidatus Omnitrophota bacterium]